MRKLIATLTVLGVVLVPNLAHAKPFSYRDRIIELLGLASLVGVIYWVDHKYCDEGGRKTCAAIAMGVSIAGHVLGRGGFSEDVFELAMEEGRERVRRARATWPQGSELATLRLSPIPGMEPMEELLTVSPVVTVAALDNPNPDGS